MRVLYFSAVIVIIDQVSKLLVKGFSIPFLDLTHNGMYHGQRISVIGEFFQLTFVENPGIAFGIDFGSSFVLAISLVRLVATVALFVYLYISREKSYILRMALALIIAGAIGNLIDRTFYGLFYDYAPLFYGRVVDFIDIRFFDIFVLSKSFGNYVFNIADVAVTAGVVLLLFSLAKDKQQISAANKTSENNESISAETRE